MNDPAPRRRRWFQFSLRTLMLFMVVCAVASAWVGPKLEQTRREDEVFSKIVSWGGYALYHDSKYPHWMWPHVRRVAWVFLGGTQVTNADLMQLAELTELERVYLAGTQVTDEGVEKLQQALPNCKIYH